MAIFQGIEILRWRLRLPNQDELLVTALAAVCVLFLVVAGLEWQSWRRQRVVVALQEAVVHSQDRLEALYIDLHTDRQLMTEAVALLVEAKDLLLRREVEKLAEDMRRSDGPLSKVPAPPASKTPQAHRNGRR